MAQREDLAAFERGFLAVDRSFSPDARAKANKRLAALFADAGTISDTRFVLALSEIAALADNGHTGVIYRGTAPDLGRVGIRVAPFRQDFVVLQAMAGQAALLGGRLGAIEGTPLARLREVAHTLTGGIASRRDRMAPLLLESPGQLHALGLTQSARQSTYSFQMPDGRAQDATLAVVSAPGGGDDDTAEVLAPGAAPGDRLRFWAEGRPITLPHSGAMVLMATERHDYLTGCEQYSDCHAAVVKHPITVKSLDPEVAAPWTLEAYAAGRDPGMEAASRVLRPR